MNHVMRIKQFFGSASPALFVLFIRISKAYILWRFLKVCSSAGIFRNLASCKWLLRNLMQKEKKDFYKYLSCATEAAFITIQLT